MTTLFIALLFPALLAYLLGSIPVGLVLGKLGGVGDIRQIGSGNIGATNMMRTGKRSLAVATLILDGAKGFAAVMLCSRLAAHLSHTPNNGYLFGMYAVVGHIWPVWLNFKGGKGVATTLGVFFAVDPLIGTVVSALWLVVFYLTRFSSLAAIVSIGISPVLAFFTDPYFAYIAFALAFIVISRHEDNIKRLMHGTETKWSKSSDPS